MSSKPHPIALTAAMLMDRLPVGANLFRGRIRESASLASDLHRIAKATNRLAVAECNGEWRPGQRDVLTGNAGKHTAGSPEWHRARNAVAALEDSIADYAQRLDRRLSKLNESLAPFALSCERRGDPRGFTLVLVSTDPNRPVPSNGMESGVWGVA